MTLATLQRHARKSTVARGHSIQWGAPFQSNGGYGVDGKCKHCGKTLVVLQRPLPNQIAIGGEAVALNCERSLPQEKVHKPGGHYKVWIEVEQVDENGDQVHNFDLNFSSSAQLKTEAAALRFAGRAHEMLQDLAAGWEPTELADDDG